MIDAEVTVTEVHQPAPSRANRPLPGRVFPKEMSREGEFMMEVGSTLPRIIPCNAAFEAFGTISVHTCPSRSNIPKTVVLP